MSLTGDVYMAFWIGTPAYVDSYIILRICQKTMCRCTGVVHYMSLFAIRTPPQDYSYWQVHLYSNCIGVSMHSWHPTLIMCTSGIWILVHTGISHLCTHRHFNMCAGTLNICTIFDMSARNGVPYNVYRVSFTKGSVYEECGGKAELRTRTGCGIGVY